MINNSNKNKLDEKIKQSLSNYKAPNQTADWAEMEKMLNAAPQSGSFKWKTVLSVCLGLAVAGGGYMLYNTMNESSAPVNTNTIIVPPPIENKVTTPVTKPESTTITEPSENNVVPAEVTVKKESPVINTAKPAETKIKKEAETKMIDSNTNPPLKRSPIFIMGNQPVFGDMLDSSRGIIGETKEKEETKKSAINHSEHPIGWDKFINADSLKKNTLKQQNDSLNVAPH